MSPVIKKFATWVRVDMPSTCLSNWLDGKISVQVAVLRNSIDFYPGCSHPTPWAPLRTVSVSLDHELSALSPALYPTSASLCLNNDPDPPGSDSSGLLVGHNEAVSLQLACMYLPDPDTLE